MITQLAILFTGVVAVYLSQQQNKGLQKYACLFGLAGQPFWMISSYATEQYGIFALSFLYAYAWGKGFYEHWIKPAQQAKISKDISKKLSGELEQLKKMSGITPSSPSDDAKKILETNSTYTKQNGGAYIPNHPDYRINSIKNWLINNADKIVEIPQDSLLVKPKIKKMYVSNFKQYDYIIGQLLFRFNKLKAPQLLMQQFQDIYDNIVSQIRKFEKNNKQFSVSVDMEKDILNFMYHVNYTINGILGNDENYMGTINKIANGNNNFESVIFNGKSQ